MSTTWRMSTLTIMSKQPTTPRNEETVEENFCEPSLKDPLGEHFNQFCEQAMVENQVDGRGRRSKLRI
jgi:hypothetical protein